MFIIRATKADRHSKAALTSHGIDNANLIATVNSRPTNEHRMPLIIRLNHGDSRRRSNQGMAATRRMNEGVKIAIVATTAPRGPLRR